MNDIRQSEWTKSNNVYPEISLMLYKKLGELYQTNNSYINNSILNESNDIYALALDKGIFQMNENNQYEQ